MKRISVEKLTEDAFAPFGKILTTEDRIYSGEEGVFRWYEKQTVVENADAVSINLLTVIKRDFVCKKFEAHQISTETIFPLTGGLIVTGIPAGQLLMDKLRAFYVPAGKGICWAEGVWHYAPYPIGGNVTCAIVFRDGTGADDVKYAYLPEEVGFKL